MINTIELSEALYNEARILAEGMEEDNSIITPNDRFNNQKKKWPLPTIEQLAKVIEEVFWSSMATEEGRPCRPRVLYLCTKDEKRPIHWFETPLPLNRENLRKFFSAHGALGYIVWRYNGNDPIIIGIESYQGGDPLDLIISTSKIGEIDALWMSFKLIALRAGKLWCLSTCALPNSSSIGKIITELVGNFELQFLHLIIKTVTLEGHGGAFWILKVGQPLGDLNIKKVENSQLLLERFKNKESRRKWLESIAYLAAIDGAVILDSSMSVQGFGAFINIPNDPIMVIRKFPDGNIKEIKSSELGGGRHRSAIQFCNQFSSSVAIVISEDGRIMLFASGEEGKNKPWCIEIASLGYSDN